MIDLCHTNPRPSWLKPSTKKQGETACDLALLMSAIAVKSYPGKTTVMSSGVVSNSGANLPS